MKACSHSDSSTPYKVLRAAPSRRTTERTAKHLFPSTRKTTQMETLAVLGRTLAFSLAAGVNLYATVALVGLASYFGWVALPPEYAVFGIASVLYLVEFVADKVPWVDTLWDAIHTFIRPIGGAALAVASLGDASPALMVGAA